MAVAVACDLYTQQQIELFEVCDLDMGAQMLVDPIDRVHSGCSYWNFAATETTNKKWYIQGTHCKRLQPFAEPSNKKTHVGTTMRRHNAATLYYNFQCPTINVLLSCVFFFEIGLRFVQGFSTRTYG